MADLASRIVSAMRAKGYSVSTEPGTYNIVYVEGMNPDGTINDDAPNKFNDTRFLITFVNGVPTIAGAWEGTTEPGRYWTENRMNPKGAARIKFGQYTAWKVGVHNGQHEALVQTGGPVTVHRDADNNYVRTGDPLDTGYFGINQHGGYDLAINNLGQSSAGCLVGREMAGHREFMRLVKSDKRYLANKAGFVFTAAILAEDDVVQAGVTAPKPEVVKSGPKYRSLIGGFYSSTPMDKSSGPVSIRMNNPGAVNGAAWERVYPGYVGEVETTTGNRSTIFETPEHGVAVWYELMKKYRSAGAITVGQIINRYGGGQDYSGYVADVVKRTGLAANREIKLEGDDDALLKFAKAMFRHEAGRETPLSDAQILYGFKFARDYAKTGQPPVSPPQPKPPAPPSGGKTYDADAPDYLPKPPPAKPSVPKDVAVSVGVGGLFSVLVHRLVDNPIITFAVVAVLAGLAIWIIKRRQS